MDGKGPIANQRRRYVAVARIEQLLGGVVGDDRAHLSFSSDIKE